MLSEPVPLLRKVGGDYVVERGLQEVLWAISHPAEVLGFSMVDVAGEEGSVPLYMNGASTVLLDPGAETVTKVVDPAARPFYDFERECLNDLEAKGVAGVPRAVGEWKDVVVRLVAEEEEGSSPTSHVWKVCPNFATCVG